MGTFGIQGLLIALRNPESRAYWEVAHLLVSTPSTHIDGLIDALTDEYPRVRSFVAYALGEIEEPRHSAHLVQLLTDKNQLVRHLAAEALGKLKYVPASRQLIRQLTNQDIVFSDNDERVCDAAARALHRIGTPEALAAVREYEAQGES